MPLAWRGLKMGDIRPTNNESGCIFYAERRTSRLRGYASRQQLSKAILVPKLAVGVCSARNTVLRPGSTYK